MIITRTPLRVSFLGGGSDFEEFFKNEIGYVFGSAINLFVYTAVLKHSALADNKYKLTYRINESVDVIEEIQHPLVREILKEHHLDSSGLHIATLADVPASTGLGSSSAFAVGLVNAITMLNAKKYSPSELASSAIHIERKVLNEPGGWQDQCHSAFGGLNLFRFQNQKFERVSQIRDEVFFNLLSNRLILVAAGETRDSGTHASITADNVPKVQGKNLAKELARIAKATADSVSSNLPAEEKLTVLAESMNKSWILKQQLGSLHSEAVIKTIDEGIKAGAVSAKLCGAGGSGFVLFILGKSTTKESFTAHFPNNKVQEIALHRAGSETGPMNWS